MVGCCRGGVIVRAILWVVLGDLLPRLEREQQIPSLRCGMTSKKNREWRRQRQMRGSSLRSE
jgi:hypothetical protein